MKRAYFQYYETFEKVVQQFRAEQEQNDFRSKIIAYGLYGTEPETLDDKEAIAWVFIKDLIDDQVHRREVQAANRAKRNAAPVYTNGEPEEEALEDPEPEEKKPAKKRTRKPAEDFTPPTVEEVREYCQERRNGISAEAFCDYYSKLKDPPWTIGSQKKPMKDWKAAVRQWEARRKPERPAGRMSTDTMAPGSAFSCAKYN